MAKISVAILGASDQPERYANKAQRMLVEYGYEPLLVNPKLKTSEGRAVVAQLSDLREPLNTLTMYVSPTVSSQLQSEILKLNPKRVIFNPGSENPTLKEALQKSGIHVVEACTLVLLRTQQFEVA